MLDAKPWKADAVIRLIFSVFICMLAGSMITALLYLPSASSSSISTTKFIAVTAAGIGCMVGTLVLLWRPWQLEIVMRRTLVILILFYGGMFAGFWVQKVAEVPSASIKQMVVAALSFQGAGVLLVMRFLREHQFSWGQAFGVRNRVGMALTAGVIVACLFLPVGWGLQQASAVLMNQLPWFHLKPEEQQSVQALRVASTIGSRMILAVVTIVLAPIAEELIFRGVLYPWVKQLGFPRFALWGTAVIFAAIHLNLVIFLPLLILAVVLTVLYERTNNLLAPIAAHSLFNGLNFAMLYLLQGKSG